MVNGLLFHGGRIVVPQSLHDRCVELAPNSHQGIVKTESLLRESVWFPGIDRKAEIVCRECLPSQAAIPKQTQSLEPLNMSPLPAGPFMWFVQVW